MATGMTDILDQIDTAIGCQQCGGPLRDSPSDDFCGESCQEAWHAGRSDPIFGYRDPLYDVDLGYRPDAPLPATAARPRLQEWRPLEGIEQWEINSEPTRWIDNGAFMQPDGPFMTTVVVHDRHGRRVVPDAVWNEAQPITVTVGDSIAQAQEIAQQINAAAERVMAGATR